MDHKSSEGYWEKMVRVLTDCSTCVPVLDKPRQQLCGCTCIYVILNCYVLQSSECVCVCTCVCACVCVFVCACIKWISFQLLKMWNTDILYTPSTYRSTFGSATTELLLRMMQITAV